MTRSPKSLFKPTGWRANLPPQQEPIASEAPVIDQEPSPETPPTETIPPDLVPVIISPGQIADNRALAGLEAQEAREQLRAHTRDVLRKASVPLDETGFDLLISNIGRANAKYEAAFDALLDTGRTLVAIQKAVGPGGYRALLEARIVQIGETNASKLRQIAMAVESGKIPPLLMPAMPRNLSGAYVIASLPSDVIEPTMKALIDRGMLPECNYRKLEQEIRSLRQSSGRSTDLHQVLERKRKSVERLQAEILELELRIRHADHRPANGET